MKPAVVVIGGTTASGKSQLALRLAAATGGVVINADSMQLYRDLRVLTARPSAEDEAQAEHALYGVLDAVETGSVGRWLELLAPPLASCGEQRRTAIVVGGTGLYLHGLLEGLSDIPEIPAELRARLRAENADVPPAELHRRLEAFDPATAKRLRPSDPQRILRALEVFAATGRSLTDWQAGPRQSPLAAEPVAAVALTPPPALVIERIGQRLTRMIAQGGLDELRQLLDRTDLPADAPLLRATGVPELRAVLEGAATLDAAVARAALATRRYAKRQRTFLRHRLARLAPFEDVDAAEKHLHAAMQHAHG